MEVLKSVKLIFMLVALILCQCSVTLLIHEADPQSRQPVVITIFARVVCLSVRPSFRPSVTTFQNLSKQKKSSSKHSDPYWRDCGSGRVDHWWHACLVMYTSVLVSFLVETVRKKNLLTQVAKFDRLYFFHFQCPDMISKNVLGKKCSVDHEIVLDQNCPH